MALDMSCRLIEIKQDMPGFNSFFGSWVCKDDYNIVIDVGPANTAHRLITDLVSLGVERVDYVLLTHIHIDHSGALADFLAHYPMAKVICHEKAIKFLVDPSALWAGSLKVLGKIAEAYGEPRPVQRDRLIPHTQNRWKDLTVIETPGHAAHHLSFSYQGQLFVGEAGGNYFLINNKEYLRPATPPRFFLDVCLNSVDRLIALGDQPICYTHFGRADSSRRLLKTFKDQLILWEKIIYEQMQNEGKGLIERCIYTLLKDDQNLSAFNKMDPDTQERERIFMANAIQGFIGYFNEKT